jgi:hypothetical protein
MFADSLLWTWIIVLQNEIVAIITDKDCPPIETGRLIIIRRAARITKDAHPSIRGLALRQRMASSQEPTAAPSSPLA